MMKLLCKLGLHQPLIDGGCTAYHRHEDERLPYTAAIFSICQECGKREVTYYHYFGRKLNAQDVPIDTLKKAVAWLNQKPIRDNVVPLKVVK